MVESGLDRVLAPADRDALRQLEMLARRAVEGIVHGLHRSRRKGVSIEFDHHTLYQPGDSLRHVDWKVSARQDRIFVRRYLEDTAQCVRLVVDRSASMAADAGAEVGKDLAAVRLAACLAWLAVHQRDSVALALVGGASARLLPARSSERHLLAMLSELAQPPTAGGAAGAEAVAAGLRASREAGGRRGLAVLVSDLQYDPAPVRAELASLQAQGHEVVVFMPIAPVEEDFPFRRWMVFADAERPGVRHRVDAVALRRIYREEQQAHRQEWVTWAAGRGAHFIPFRSDAPISGLLAAYLARRRGEG
jgi:uncharacterized protein (DUF58 family)